MLEDFYCKKVITMSINSYMNTHQEAYPRLVHEHRGPMIIYVCYIQHVYNV
jgi:hypothetical protein